MLHHERNLFCLPRQKRSGKRDKKTISSKSSKEYGFVVCDLDHPEVKKSLMDTIESIKEEMASGVHPTVTHYSDMPASHDASSNSVDYRNAVYSDNVSSLTHEIKRLKEIQFEVRNTINCIKNNYLARILYLYYDKDLTWEKVAEEG